MNERKSPQKILVTGGAGYIGLHTSLELIEAGYEVVIVDDLSRSESTMLERLNGLVERSPSFHRVDCTDQEALEEVFREEAPLRGVIHFAAYKSVGESMEDPLLYYENNVGGQLALLRAMEKYDIKELVFSSSCTVYGQPDELPVTENSPEKEPDSPYGKTKRVCEWIIEDQVDPSKGMQAISLRYFNPIGAHPSGKIGEHSPDKPTNLVPYITGTASGALDELVVNGDDYDTPDGTCIRDYIHVMDLARAHVKALEKLEKEADKGGYEVFNVGTGEGASVLEAIQAFEEATGISIPYRIGPRRPGDVEQIWADTQKAERELGWSARYTLSDAMRDAWKWEQERPELKKQKGGDH